MRGKKTEIRKRNIRELKCETGNPGQTSGQWKDAISDTFNQIGQRILD